MKLNVPFYKSTNDTDCGPLALKMVLEFFGEKHSIEEIAKEERQTSTGLVWSAGIALAAKRFGFDVKFISTSNFDNHDNDYYKKYANDKAMIVLKELSEEIKNTSVVVEESNISLDRLLSHVSENSLPIVLVNWFIISGKKGFSGHFLTITGYDEENVYVHNPGLENSQSHLPIKKDLFLKAWESEGTDKDTVVVSKSL